MFFEDSAALIGLLLAFAGVGLHQLTGSAFWDGLASVLIAVLLTAVAYILGGTNKGLLIGRQADRRTVYALRDALAERREVEQVVDLLTMTLGTDQILLCARLDFDDALDAASLERACAAIDADLRERFPDVAEIFVEPVPRTDPAIRARVLERYGQAGAERLRTGERPPPVIGLGAASGDCSMVALLQSDWSRATLLQSRTGRRPPAREAPRPGRAAGPSWRRSAQATSGRSVGSIGRGRTSRPVRYASTPAAAERPSEIAHTISDCPRPMSPAVNTPGTLVMKLWSRATLPRGSSSTPSPSSSGPFSGPTKPMASSTSCAGISCSVPSTGTKRPFSSRVTSTSLCVATLPSASPVNSTVFTA